MVGVQGFQDLWLYQPPVSQSIPASANCSSLSQNHSAHSEEWITMCPICPKCFILTSYGETNTRFTSPFTYYVPKPQSTTQGCRAQMLSQGSFWDTSALITDVHWALRKETAAARISSVPREDKTYAVHALITRKQTGSVRGTGTLNEESQGVRKNSART